MADTEDILNNEFFNDIVDTPKEATEQHKKQEELKEYHRQGQARA